MAEAHAAVGFSFHVTHEGLNVEYNHEAIKAIWHSGFHAWRMRFVRFKNHIINSMHPAPPMSFFVVIAVTIGMQLYSNFDLSCGSIDYVKSMFPSCVQSECTIIGAAVFGLLVWVLFIYTWRLALRLLLTYHGWMYEPHGRMSLSTKIWLVLERLLKGRNSLLYSYEACLPKLPVPDLQDTKSRYLRSVRPLLDDAKYERMSRLAEEFFGGIGKKMQRYLVLKSWWAQNYVSDWWEEYVYLAGRSPIMVNSNYYGLDLLLLLHETKVQAARAGNVVYCFLKYREELDHETIRPIFVNGCVPLSSSQYDRMFQTTRVPGIEADKIVHFKTSDHIVVYNRGRYFKVYTHSGGKLLQPRDLEMAFQSILDDTSEPAKGEEHVAALTAGERTPWAKARQQYFSTGVNRASLAAIERAAFVLALDGDEHDYDPADHTKLDRWARAMLHGKCYDRWFDKTFTLVVCANGRIGFNAEHAWADAPVMSQAWEYMIHYDYQILGYADDGHCKGDSTSSLNPVRLQWELPAECIKVAEGSLRVAEALASDVDLHIEVHNAYGKRLVKKAKVSPDAYIQMALQLAYYRDSKKFCLTYESSMTRLFREGRTETVRSCTTDTCAFARAMDDDSKSKEEKIALMRTAAETHQQMYRDAMTGRGIDRHLFCLYVVSKYLGIDSPFLKEVLSEPWRLSTSQTPHVQLGKMDLDKYPNFLCTGGGFGPVSDDGYGVSYIIAGEDNIFFHISCKKHCETTDSYRFGKNITKAMADMKALFS